MWSCNLYFNNNYASKEIIYLQSSSYKYEVFILCTLIPEVIWKLHCKCNYKNNQPKVNVSHHALPITLHALWRDMLRERALFSSLSSGCCASAALFMPFVCVGGRRVVTVIAFERGATIFAFLLSRSYSEGCLSLESVWQECLILPRSGTAVLRTDLAAVNIPAEQQNPHVQPETRFSLPESTGKMVNLPLLLSCWGLGGWGKQQISANDTMRITEAEDSSSVLGFVLLSEHPAETWFHCFFGSQTQPFPALLVQQPMHSSALGNRKT